MKNQMKQKTLSITLREEILADQPIRQIRRNLPDKKKS